MVILASLLLVLLLGAANPLAAPIFQRPDSTHKTNTPDRQRGTHPALPGTESTNSVQTG